MPPPGMLPQTTASKPTDCWSRPSFRSTKSTPCGKRAQDLDCCSVRGGVGYEPLAKALLIRRPGSCPRPVVSYSCCWPCTRPRCSGPCRRRRGSCRCSRRARLPNRSGCSCGGFWRCDVEGVLCWARVRRCWRAVGSMIAGETLWARSVVRVRSGIAALRASYAGYFAQRAAQRLALCSG